MAVWRSTSMRVSTCVARCSRTAVCVRPSESTAAAAKPSAPNSGTTSTRTSASVSLGGRPGTTTMCMLNATIT
eukprot:1800431-Pleurochrysis_carterae.AAC.7